MLEAVTYQQMLQEIKNSEIGEKAILKKLKKELK